MGLYKVNLGKATSALHGYGNAGMGATSFSFGSSSLGGNSSTSSSFTLPINTGMAGTIIMIRVNGGGTTADGKWTYYGGYFLNRLGTGKPDLRITTSRNASNITFFVTFQNTAAAAATIPAMTIDVKVLLFAPPW